MTKEILDKGVIIQTSKQPDGDILATYKPLEVEMVGVAEDWDEIEWEEAWGIMRGYVAHEDDGLIEDLVGLA